jgi:hypothetical protein
MTITLTHPTDPSITWVSGKVGKRPNWVKEILLANPNLLPSKEKEVFVPASEDSTPRLRYWKWNGLNDEDGKGAAVTTPCLVGAMSAQEALVALNKTFKTAVMATEWATCWKEVSPSVVELGGRLGVFVWNKATTAWDERKCIASSNSGKH